MRRFSLVAIALLIGPGSLISSGQLQAGFVTETVSTPTAGTATDFSLALAVPTFDRQLGTLQAVTVSFTDSATMQGWVMNTAPVMESFHVIESSAFTLSLFNQKMLSNSLTAQGTCANMTGGEVASFGMHQASGASPAMTMMSGSMFSAFESSSPTVSFNFSSLTSTESIGGGGNSSTGIYTTAWATVNVTYQYFSPATVPEPSSLVMILVGACVVTVAAVLENWKRLR